MLSTLSLVIGDAGQGGSILTEYFLLVISAIFVSNILLMQYLGNCPFLGCSKNISLAIGMGSAVVFVVTLSTALTWLVGTYFLNALDIAYLQTIVFIVVIAALVQFVETFLKKMLPPLYQAMGIFLPLITTNCCVLGLAIICQTREDMVASLVKTIVFAFASAVGFSFALLLMAGIRERIAISRIPKPLQGTAIGLVLAGMMSLAFFAFQKMI